MMMNRRQTPLKALSALSEIMMLSHSSFILSNQSLQSRYIFKGRAEGIGKVGYNSNPEGESFNF